MMPAVREHLWAFVLYLQNFLFAAKPEVFRVMLAHFWTLAVEEQFYVTWPFVVLLVPRARLALVLFLLVLTGPLFRQAGVLAGFDQLPVDLMMPSHFDTLGLGGLYAVLARGNDAEKAWARRLVWAGPRIGLPLGLLGYAATLVNIDVFQFWLGELVIGLFSTWLIAGAAVGFGGVGGRILNLGALQYVGKISYGIYVYHFNVPGLLREKLFPKLGLGLPDSLVLRFAISTAVAIAIAAASWHLFEEPINRLKGRFNYGRPLKPPKAPEA
jgi:peptidoglycan/LPS O-acetylase OafA/YrhL